MAERARHTDVRPYLPFALAATAAVVVVPLALVALLIWIAEPDPPLLALGVFGASLSIVAAMSAASWWTRRTESAELTFGELMIWGWVRRKRAEDQLTEGTNLLGLTRDGSPTREPRVSRHDQLQVLRDLSDALEAKDPYTHGHSRRVERHAYRTALAMGLSVHEIEDLRRAAALHDVGKIRVPDRLLRKPSQLTIEERSVVEEHVLVGSWMVSRVATAQVVEAVRHHHERWDGHGYPDGLFTTDIPLFARIIAVADAYDAMTSTRPYRAGLGRREAIDAIKASAGIQFDPEVVDAFLQTLPMPVPLAGLLPLLMWPDRIARKVTFYAKRVGVDQVAQAATATGAAVMIGVSMVSPHAGLDAKRPATHDVQAATQSSSRAGTNALASQDQVLGLRLGSAQLAAKAAPVRATADDAKAKKSKSKKAKLHVRADDALARPGKQAKGSHGGVLGVTGDDKKGNGNGTSASGEKPKGDPQPEHGSDCEDKSSRGSDNHCGTNNYDGNKAADDKDADVKDDGSKQARYGHGRRPDLDGGGKGTLDDGKDGDDSGKDGDDSGNGHSDDRGPDEDGKDADGADEPKIGDLVPLER